MAGREECLLASIPFCSLATQARSWPSWPVPVTCLQGTVQQHILLCVSCRQNEGTESQMLSLPCSHWDQEPESKGQYLPKALLFTQVWEPSSLYSHCSETTCSLDLIVLNVEKSTCSPDSPSACPETGHTTQTRSAQSRLIKDSMKWRYGDAPNRRDQKQHLKALGW